SSGPAASRSCWRACGTNPIRIPTAAGCRPRSNYRRRPARLAGPLMTVLLSTQGLTKAYGPRPLFADLALDLRAGERVGLIGPNGAGKTTLLRLLRSEERRV